MKPEALWIYELAAWGFDSEADRTLLDADVIRSAARMAEAILRERATHHPASPFPRQEGSRLQKLLSDRAESVARSEEFDGLDWKLDTVDLERLLAFQRRLGFDEKHLATVPDLEDSEALLDLTIPRVCLCPGYTSPYLEVALYRDRWFLRDGYHRSYSLLRRGIHCVPAVVLHARTIGDLGAVGHKFFSEEILFCARPPMVSDFANEALTVRYLRRELSSLDSIPASSVGGAGEGNDGGHGDANVELLFGN
jgi:hypothetical protein